MSRSKGIKIAGGISVGPVYRAGDGRWRFKVRYPRDPETRERAEASFTRKTHRGAVALRNEWIAIHTEAITIEELIEQFGDAVVRRRNNTERGYRTAMNRLRMFFRDHMSVPIDECHESVCVECIEGMHDRNASVQHQLHSLRRARAMFRWAIKKRIMRGPNPTESLEIEGTPGRRKEQLRGHELEKLLAWCQAQITGSTNYEHYGLAILLTYWCGLRAAECTGLKKRDIEPDGSSIHVGTKTRKSVRTPPVPEHLQALLAFARAELILDTDLLFPYNSQWLTRHAMTSACREAGVPRVVAHSLRGSFASGKRRRGQPLAKVADDIGHESARGTRVTSDHYVTVDAELWGQLMERLQSFGIAPPKSSDPFGLISGSGEVRENTKPKKPH